jgi:aminocarboxymuconate-semialdehyde decarboxylase
MTDPEKRVSLLEKLGIDHMIVSAGPPSYMYWVDAKVAIPFISWRNEQHAGYCRGHEDRLSFLATIPGQDVDASLEEIDHGIELGARGIMIGADNIGGRELDDPAFWPLYDKVEKSGQVLFIHPYPMGTPTKAPDPYHLSWGPGYAYQETLAFARLTLGGVLDDFPGLKVHITHGCGFVPYQLGRLNTSFEMEPDVRGKKPPEEYLDNFFFDLQLHDLRARRFFYEWAGPDRLVIGDNFGGWDAADGFVMLDELQLPEHDQRKIEGDNAIRLFGLESVLGTPGPPTS